LDYYIYLFVLFVFVFITFLLYKCALVTFFIKGYLTSLDLNMQVCTSSHITTPTSYHSGRMLFLPPNQQRQSTG